MLKKNYIITKNTIVINSADVITSDPKGNKYFMGRLQYRNEMTKLYFDKAKQFWAKQKINGKALNLLEIQVKMAQNNVIPYNMPVEKNIIPIVSDNDRLNHVAWYKLKFENIDTGWICNKFFYNPIDAASSIGVDTVFQIYNDKKTIACINKILEKQK